MSQKQQCKQINTYNDTHFSSSLYVRPPVRKIITYDMFPATNIFALEQYEEKRKGQANRPRDLHAAG